MKSVLKLLVQFNSHCVRNRHYNTNAPLQWQPRDEKPKCPDLYLALVGSLPLGIEEASQRVFLTLESFRALGYFSQIQRCFFNPLGHFNWDEQIFFRLDIRILRIILSLSTKNQLRSLKPCRDSLILRNPVVVTFQLRTAQLLYLSLSESSPSISLCSRVVCHFLLFF